MLKSVARAGAALLVASPLITSDAGAQTRWRLQEIARAGGADEGLSSFNEIRDLQLDVKGQVWVLDGQVQSLRLVSADGKSVREVARKGKGPGEITRANGIQRAPDGRMVVRDEANGGYQLYDAEGRGAGRVLVSLGGYGWWWRAGIDSAGRVTEDWSVRRGEESVPVLIRRTLKGATIDTVDRPATCESRPLPKGFLRSPRGAMQIPFVPELRLAFAPDGSLWCGRNDDYVFRRFTLGSHAHDVEVKGTAPLIPVPKVERDSMIEALSTFLLKTGGSVEPWSNAMVPTARPAIRQIDTDDQGRLWVLRETVAGPLEFDIWDARGHRVATLTTPYRQKQISIFRVLGDRVAMSVLDEDDVPNVVVARIVR